MAKETQGDQNIRSNKNSVAVGSVSVGGSVDGSLLIGSHNVVGFTPEQVSTLITQISTTFQPKPFDGRSPYKGLDAFEEEDAELFFGRENLVSDLVVRVQESRTLFVTGPSGSGKSSLVRAGLLPALRGGGIKDLHSERWLYETLKPGRNPLGELARVVSRMAGTTTAGQEIRSKAETDKNILAEWCDIALKEGRDKRAVLFIDQFEEVFTQISKEAERQIFLNLLTCAGNVENGRVIIIFAMRSDFVSNCATFPELNELLNRQFIQIGAMQPRELVSAIAQPALRVGLRIDPDLIAQIINDMQGEPGALPLMQFALKDLFDSELAEGGMIALTLNDYLARGGIHKSLERHADHSFTMLDKNEQDLARSIFSGLIEIGQGTQDTRRTALLDELVPSNTKISDVENIIHKLADARLVTTDEQAGRDTVTISHEKLIDAWPWLKKLVNENRDVIALQNQISSDAKEWEDHKRDPSYLYTGARLANVREQLKAQKLVLSGLAQDFVQSGRARQQRGRLFLITSLATIFSLMFVAVIVFSNQSRANAELAQTALARQLAAQAQSIFLTGNWKQMTAVLLAVESVRISPTGPPPEAIQVLENNILALPLAAMKHDRIVWSVAFSPDGSYVVSGSGDRTVRVWEAATGKEIARMLHEGSVNTVAFSPDGAWIVSASSDGSARIWEAATGKEIARMTHEAMVNMATFSPDGKHVVSGSEDSTARIWEASTGRENVRIRHDAGVKSVAFSSDGKYVVSGSDDFTVRVTEVLTGTEIARMTHTDTVNSVMFSPDGKYVVSGSSDYSARVWEVATGKEISSIMYGDIVNSVAFSPDGKFVVSASGNHFLTLWEAATGEKIFDMLHDNNVRCVAFSPDGKYLVSGSRDGTARVWDVTTGKEVTRMTHENRVWAVAFSPDGKYVASASEDHSAQVWEATTGKDVVRLAHEGRVWSAAFSPDGRYIVSGSGDWTARVWNAATGQEVARMTHENGANSVAFSPDGKYVVSASGDHTVRVWQAATGKEIVRMSHDGGLKSVAFSPDGKYVASASSDRTARVWEVATGKEIAHLTHDDEVRSVAFSPDGKYLVSGSLDRTLRIWEALTGLEIARMRHAGSVNSVAFSPDGKYVASASGDQTACVWDVATEQKIVCVRHDSNTRSVAFSPDGKFVVSASRDETARVWETTTGHEVTRIIHSERFNSVAFSPDGKYIISGSEDSIVRVWLWRPEDLIDKACTRVTRTLTRAEWQQYLDNQPYQAVCPNLPLESQSAATATSVP